MKNPPYDCDRCVAYCCGYPVIETKPADIRRLARHFALTAEEAKERFTEQENNRVRKMKQRHDKVLNTPTCIFLNQKTRNCSVYKARPQICRDYPGDRCEWNDRRLLEGIAGNGKKVIRLKVMPWTIDGDYPLYTEKKLPALVEAYARHRGVMKRPKRGG
jgi:Fe-S-cluster containining protein